MIGLIPCLFLLMVAYPTTVSAQRCGATCANAESLLGSSEQALMASIPELKRIPKPVKGPRNSRGKWLLPDLYFAKQPYAATYYIEMGKVIQIDLLSTAPRLQCKQRTPFELALLELGKAYEKSRTFGIFEDGGKSMQSVVFNSQEVDVSVHFSLAPEDCATKVIYRIHDGIVE